MKTFLSSIFAFLALLSSLCLGGEKWELYYQSKTADEFAIDLAHPEKGKIKLPVGAANIRAVIEADHYLIGVTKPEYGKYPPLVFRFDLKTNELIDYIDFSSFGEEGRLPSLSLVATKNNRVYLGTYGDTLSTGNLFSIDISGEKLKVEPLGSASDKHGIYTMALSADSSRIYGILSPDNAFFSYDIGAKKFEIFQESTLDTNAKKEAEGVYNKGEPVNLLHGREAALCGALAVDKSGKVFGSTGRSKLFYFDVAARKIMKPIGFPIPYLRDHAATNHVASWALAENGKWYGGTTIDGILFSLDPKTLEICNLGKPAMTGNIKSLFIRKGVVHGLVGENLDYTHYFTYEIDKSNFDDKGFFRFINKMTNGRNKTYTASQISLLKDGRVLVAEDDLLPTFIFFKP